MTRTIDRDGWKQLCTEYGGDAKQSEGTTTMACGRINFSDTDGHHNVDLYPTEDGLDIRAYDVQVLVSRNRIAVVQHHTPYPIQRWTVLWEGELV